VHLHYAGTRRARSGDGQQRRQGDGAVREKQIRSGFDGLRDARNEGDELVAAIKARAPKQPIVMVTADAEKLRDSGRVPAGVDFLIGKPFSLEILREAIATVLPEKCLAE